VMQLEYSKQVLRYVICEINVNIIQGSSYCRADIFNKCTLSLKSKGLSIASVLQSQAC